MATVESVSNPPTSMVGVIDSIEPEILDRRIRSIRKELSRHRIAIWFIWGYLILLTLTFVTPTVLYLLSRPSGALSIVDLKDLLQAFSGGLSGLTGILGFVVGYYFKGEEQARPDRIGVEQRSG